MSIDTPVYVFVPSRGRPGNIAELWQSITDTKTGDVTLIVGVDRDDPEVRGYLEVYMDRYKYEDGPKFNMHIGRPSRLGPWLNRLARMYWDDGAILSFLGDDHRPRSAGWDREVAEAAGDKGIVYGNDLLQRENLATAVFITSNIVKELGFYVPEGMVHMFLDNFWGELGRRSKTLTYLPDTIIEHMHFSNGKSEGDDTYRATNNGEMMSSDEVRYKDWLEDRADHDAEKVKAL